ncbi:tetratricopeptide repeat protein [Fundidesulfovibrio butyratiphilus]
MYPSILGVYSLRKAEDVGVGATASRHDQVTYWYARQMSPDMVEVQPLNVYHVPSGMRSTLRTGDFLCAYSPEPRYYQTHTAPALKSLAAKISQGEKYFSMGLLDEAEKAFIKALMIDESNIPANYGLGEVYTEKNDYARLKGVLSVLLGMNEAFTLHYRQKLNSFGISLRKQGFLDESQKFFCKALEVQGDDEHLYFNLARVLYEKGEMDRCLDSLRHAVQLNGEFLEARKFIAHCERQSQHAVGRQH